MIQAAEKRALLSQKFPERLDLCLETVQILDQISFLSYPEALKISPIRIGKTFISGNKAKGGAEAQTLKAVDS